MLQQKALRTVGLPDKPGLIERAKIPYKLLQLTSRELQNELWNHQSIGESFFVNAFCGRVPVIGLSDDNLINDLDELQSLGRSVKRPVICEMDSIENEGEYVFTVKSASADSIQTQKRTWKTLSGSIEFINNLAAENVDCFNPMDFEFLKFHSLENNTISFDQLVILNAKCFVNRNAIYSKFYLIFNMAVLSMSFRFTNILPIPIIPTALSKGLSDLIGNCFLHNQPKAGYVTLDDIHRGLLVLDSDPKLSCIPVFGIWISGVQEATDAFVWAACLRYFHVFHSRNSSQFHDPFLVIIYKKGVSTPTFFDCQIRNPMDIQEKLDLDVYQAFGHHSILKQNNEKMIFFKLEKKFCNLSATQCLKIQSSVPKINKLAIKKPGLMDGSSHDLSNDIWSDTDGTSSSIKESSSERPEKELERRQCTQNKVLHSPPPNELYSLIKAQEEQLRLLRAQLDSLLKIQNDKSAPSLSSPPQPAVSNTKETISISTMTSLVWIPPVHNQHNASPNFDNKILEAKTDMVASPEVLRRDIQSEISLSPMQRVEESMANLQLTTFTESIASSMPSIHVELNDYTHSYPNLSAWPAPSPDQSSTNIGNLYDESFYDSLLNKIENVLCKQNFRDTVTDISEFTSKSLQRSKPNQKSIFESLVIPCLNYVSLLPSEMDNDYSIEFRALTRKYFNDNASECFPTLSNTKMDETRCSTFNNRLETSECGLSYASQQFLQKYGLGRLNENCSSID